jgi:hypothetical protein
MDPDLTARDFDPTGIPAEFRENYRFLSQLICCKSKNSTAISPLNELCNKHLQALRGKLNRRQLKIIKDFLLNPNSEGFEPPVPEELEASIRIKNKSRLLPWEEEAIDKIDKWRSDLECISRKWSKNGMGPADLNSKRCTKTR